MEELMILGNPRRRRHKKHRAKSHRRHRRMSAKQMLYFGGGAHRNPSKRRHRRRSAVRSIGRRIRRATRGYSIRGLVSSPLATLKPAMIGAIGATAVNTILGKVPLPATLMTGRMRYVTQGIAAVLLGTVASRFAGGATAAKMAEGSLTVTLHQALTDIAGGMGVNLSGMGYYLPGYGVSAAPAPTGNAARLSGMGRYMTGPGSSVVPFRRMSGMGNISTSFRF